MNKNNVLIFILLVLLNFAKCGKLTNQQFLKIMKQNEDKNNCNNAIFRNKRFVSLPLGGFLQSLQASPTTALPEVAEDIPTTTIVTDAELVSPAPEVIPCFSADGGAGHCSSLMSTCLITSFRAAPLTLYKYFCILGTGYIGICCPNEEPKIQNIQAKPSSKDEDVVEENGNRIDDVVFKENPEDPEIRGCGVNNPDRNTKIVGGHPARIREWPWMAALMKGSDNRWDKFCGGALITDRHVLTAAHCLSGNLGNEIRVRLGEYDFSTPNEVHSKDFKVIEVRMHDAFKDSTMYLNDIAIVKLHRPTGFNDDVWPICLPPNNDMFENQPATVIGWGTQAYGGPVSDILLQAEISVWRQSECDVAFKRSMPLVTLCAGEHKGRKDSCQGDSGGPLMSQLKSGRWILVGVVSWGIRCGEYDKPGLYTRVNQYLDWIVDNSIF